MGKSQSKAIIEAGDKEIAVARDIQRGLIEWAPLLYLTAHRNLDGHEVLQLLHARALGESVQWNGVCARAVRESAQPAGVDTTSSAAQTRAAPPRFKPDATVPAKGEGVAQQLPHTPRGRMHVIRAIARMRAKRAPEAADADRGAAQPEADGDAVNPFSWRSVGTGADAVRDVPRVPAAIQNKEESGLRSATGDVTSNDESCSVCGDLGSAWGGGGQGHALSGLCPVTGEGGAVGKNNVRIGDKESRAQQTGEGAANVPGPHREMLLDEHRLRLFVPVLGGEDGAPEEEAGEGELLATVDPDAWGAGEPSPEEGALVDEEDEGRVQVSVDADEADEEVSVWERDMKATRGLMRVLSVRHALGAVTAVAKAGASVTSKGVARSAAVPAGFVARAVAPTLAQGTTGERSAVPSEHGSNTVNVPATAMSAQQCCGVAAMTWQVARSGAGGKGGTDRRVGMTLKDFLAAHSRPTATAAEEKDAALGGAADEPLGSIDHSKAGLCSCSACVSRCVAGTRARWALGVEWRALRGHCRVIVAAAQAVRIMGLGLQGAKKEEKRLSGLERTLVRQRRQRRSAMTVQALAALAGHAQALRVWYKRWRTALQLWVRLGERQACEEELIGLVLAARELRRQQSVSEAQHHASSSLYATASVDTTPIFPQLTTGGDASRPIQGKCACVNAWRQAAAAGGVPSCAALLLPPWAGVSTATRVEAQQVLARVATGASRDVPTSNVDTRAPSDDEVIPPNLGERPEAEAWATLVAAAHDHRDVSSALRSLQSGARCSLTARAVHVSAWAARELSAAGVGHGHNEQRRCRVSCPTSMPLDVGDGDNLGLTDAWVWSARPCPWTWEAKDAHDASFLKRVAHRLTRSASNGAPPHQCPLGAHVCVVAARLTATVDRYRAVSAICDVLSSRVHALAQWHAWSVPCGCAMGACKHGCGPVGAHIATSVPSETATSYEGSEKPAVRTITHEPSGAVSRDQVADEEDSDEDEDDDEEDDSEGVTATAHVTGGDQADVSGECDGIPALSGLCVGALPPAVAAAAHASWATRAVCGDAVLLGQGELGGLAAGFALMDGDGDGALSEDEVAAVGGVAVGVGIPACTCGVNRDLRGAQMTGGTDGSVEAGASSSRTGYTNPTSACSANHGHESHLINVPPTPPTPDAAAADTASTAASVSPADACTAVFERSAPATCAHGHHGWLMLQNRVVEWAAVTQWLRQEAGAVRTLVRTRDELTVTLIAALAKRSVPVPSTASAGKSTATDALTIVVTPPDSTGGKPTSVPVGLSPSAHTHNHAPLAPATLAAATELVDVCEQLRHRTCRLAALYGAFARALTAHVRAQKGAPAAVRLWHWHSLPRALAAVASVATGKRRCGISAPSLFGVGSPVLPYTAPQPPITGDFRLGVAGQPQSGALGDTTEPSGPSEQENMLNHKLFGHDQPLPRPRYGLAWRRATGAAFVRDWLRGMGLGRAAVLCRAEPDELATVSPRLRRSWSGARASEEGLARMGAVAAGFMFREQLRRSAAQDSQGVAAEEEKTERRDHPDEGAGVGSATGLRPLRHTLYRVSTGPPNRGAGGVGAGVGVVKGGRVEADAHRCVEVFLLRVREAAMSMERERAEVSAQVFSLTCGHSDNSDARYR